MGNPFQDQLLKAGIVSKQQVNKANQEKARKNKQQRNHNAVDVNKEKQKAKQAQAAAEKVKRDKELNQQKEQQAKNKAISIEINQLISNNCLARDEGCEIIYNFEHRKKVNRIYVDEDMKKRIVNGSLGIARIEGRYELVPKAIAEKIQQRNEKRIVLFEAEQESTDKDDPYADYQIPDDLTW